MHFRAREDIKGLIPFIFTMAHVFGGYAQFISYVLFVLGLFLLIKGADWFIDGASAIAKRLGVSSFFIGLTVVAFGTSAPELVVSITSALHGKNDIALGNILGSNISNILLILGIATVIHPLVIRRASAWKEIPFSLFAIVLLGLMASDALWGGNGMVSLVGRVDGLILLFCFVAFLIYSVSIRSVMPEEGAAVAPSLSLARGLLIGVVGMFGLLVGGTWVVDGAVLIANNLGMSEAVIGLTIIAIGTSLPELMTSVVAAYRRNADIAVGNIIGSNIFNVFFVLGLTSVLAPIRVPRQLISDIVVAIIATILLLIGVFTGQKYLLDRKYGYMFITLYASYLLFLILRELQ